ncbi:hypothetical protein KBD69_02545 [Candidatus Woesebacteria bacterium]|nr:hypothetical protein [Candidatus Woesebacteria bacterium]
MVAEIRRYALALFILLIFGSTLILTCKNTLFSDQELLIKLRLKCQSLVWHYSGYLAEPNDYMPPFVPINSILVLNKGNAGYTYKMYATYIDYDESESVLTVFDYNQKEYQFKLSSEYQYYVDITNIYNNEPIKSKKLLSELKLDDRLEIMWLDVRDLRGINLGLKTQSRLDIGFNNNSSIIKITSDYTN